MSDPAMSDPAIAERAPAKINLFLHVGPARADGLHDLYSLFVFAELGDIISVRNAAALSLDIAGPFADALAGAEARDNLIWRAAEALAARAGRAPGAAIRLEKKLPVAAGIGGGSADAAAALRALRRLWGLRTTEAELAALAFSLGADVPACLGAAPVRVAGAGERLAPAPPIPPLHVVLVNPRVAAPTGPVFKAFDASPPPAGPFAPPLADFAGDAAGFVDFLAAQRNDLEAPATALIPQIGAVLEALRAAPQTRLARMSGSGATCFALCSGAREAAGLARDLAARRPQWWIAPTRLLTGREPALAG